MMRSISILFTIIYKLMFKYLVGLLVPEKRENVLH